MKFPLQLLPYEAGFKITAIVHGRDYSSYMRKICMYMGCGQCCQGMGYGQSSKAL